LDKDVYVCKISKKGYEEKGEIIDSSKSISILNVDLKEKADNYTNRQNEANLEDANVTVEYDESKVNPSEIKGAVDNSGRYELSL